mmetsp:Transcript_27599/g.66336  ORF Transcript_27599/g.66336 Transcript_27599/m.66336 type:complete len:245 (-) Transcript_27599:5262-5996(-)
MIKGTCHCKQISVLVSGNPKSCSICHCTVCRSLSCSYFSIQSLHDRRNIKITATTSDTAKAAGGGKISTDKVNVDGETDEGNDEEETSIDFVEIDLSSSSSGTSSSSTEKNFVLGYQTSPYVTRYRCSKCFSPVYATLGKANNIIAIPQLVLFPQKKKQKKKTSKNEDETKNQNDDEENRSVFDIPKAFQPTHHMYYSDRFPKQLVDKLFFDDGLPKFVGSSAPNRCVVWTNELESEHENLERP